MATIEIITLINNSQEVVFDLSRSIDLHLKSTAKTNEKAVAGVTCGLIGPGETVTWEAYHLFKTRRFTSAITEFNYPFSFTDEMIKGDLKKFSHRHTFERIDSGTSMKDVIFMIAPYGLIGKFVMEVFLKNYFLKFLKERNAMIKEYAETNNQL